MPTRGTTAAGIAIASASRFQSTCPRGARLRPFKTNKNHMHFNPRAHEGHDPSIINWQIRFTISIHVPTRGTTQLCTLRCCFAISIHVPTRGTTECDIHWSYFLGNFNPRAHEGHDFVHCVWLGFRGISIHVPTRGTTAACPECHTVSRFQSTCPRGARLNFPLRHAIILDISIHVPTRGTTYMI